MFGKRYDPEWPNYAARECSCQWMLFNRPPGTGKTRAAQMLVHALSYLLFGVDLSQIDGEYIGETEKNPDDPRGRRSPARGAVPRRAGALFGKRSDVKPRNDRCANMEVGYLFQRLETHDGTAILATNREWPSKCG